MPRENPGKIPGEYPGISRIESKNRCARKLPGDGMEFKRQNVFDPRDSSREVKASKVVFLFLEQLEGRLKE